MIERLDAAALRARDDPGSVLDAHPWLGTAIDADAAADRFGAWAGSTVMDEHAGTAVVPPALFAALHARAGIDARWPIGNAGLLHVYGYLLSTTPTPYGLKRERWMDGALARAYGLPADAFVPWAQSRTLLDRVTTAASRLLADHATRSCDIRGLESTMALARERGEGPWALAYSVHGRLVTTFPVTSAEAVLAEWDAAPARLRWNAVA